MMKIRHQQDMERIQNEANDIEESRNNVKAYLQFANEQGRK